MNWVKLSERKPPRETKYLVYAPSAELGCPLMTTAWYHPKGDKWSLILSPWDQGITHWMEILPPADPD